MRGLPVWWYHRQDTGLVSPPFLPPSLSIGINWDTEFLLEIPAWLLSSIERKPKTFILCVKLCTVLCLEIGKFSSCYLVLLWSRVESRPDNIKLLLEKFSTRVLIVTKLQVTQNFPNTESKYFRLWGGYFACLFVLITTTTYQSFNIIFNKFSFVADRPDSGQIHISKLIIIFQSIAV